MHKSRVRLMLVALFGVLALGAMTAVASQAANPAPRWSIGGRNLEANETHYITAKAYPTAASPTFTLTAGSGATAKTVSCESVRLKSGVLLGTAAETAGKNNEVIEFFGKCEVTNNGTPCKVTEPIVTNPVKSELVETEKAVPGTSGSLLVLFEPEVKANGFVKLEFTGSGCVVKETIVSGQAVAQVLTDPENGTLGSLVELPKVNSAEAKSWLLNFPKTAIKKNNQNHQRRSIGRKKRTRFFRSRIDADRYSVSIIGKKE